MSSTKKLLLLQVLLNDVGNSAFLNFAVTATLLFLVARLAVATNIIRCALSHSLIFLFSIIILDVLSLYYFHLNSHFIS